MLTFAIIAAAGVPPALYGWWVSLRAAVVASEQWREYSARAGVQS